MRKAEKEKKLTHKRIIIMKKSAISGTRDIVKKGTNVTGNTIGGENGDMGMKMTTGGEEIGKKKKRKKKKKQLIT